jgi:hypothetical protein
MESLGLEALAVEPNGANRFVVMDFGNSHPRPASDKPYNVTS